MDKKPLIGVCILAVVLLVMGSLSNVVGYQSVKSTMNEVPKGFSFGLVGDKIVQDQYLQLYLFIVMLRKYGFIDDVR